jgi:hypothetical protein
MTMPRWQNWLSEHVDQGSRTTDAPSTLGRCARSRTQGICILVGLGSTCGGGLTPTGERRSGGPVQTVSADQAG